MTRQVQHRIIAQLREPPTQHRRVAAIFHFQIHAQATRSPQDAGFFCFKVQLLHAAGRGTHEHHP